MPLLPSMRWIVTWILRVTFIVLVIHVFVYFRSGATDFTLAPPIAILFVLALGWLGVADARWRGEMHFLTTLGVAPTAIGMMWASVALLLEAGILLLAGLVRN